MGLFSSSKASESSTSLTSAGIATLGGVQISLTLLEKLMDSVPLPFVKGAAGAAIEVIKIARSIQTNRQECDDLLKRTASLLVVILDSFKDKSGEAIPDHLRRAVDRLTANFHEVLNDLKIIDKRAGKPSATGIGRALLYHFDNTDKLKGCSSKLDWAMGEFQVSSKIDSCLKDLERHEELRKDVREGRAEMRENQAEIREGLTEIREAVKEQTTTKVLSELPSTVLPANPRIFGRQDYVEKAIQLLLSDTAARLAILGPGGIGKTSVSLKIVHDARVISRFGKERHWVPCEQATSLTFFVELLAKSLNLPSSASPDRFGEVITTLESAAVPQLFLLDNFETPWDIEGQQSDVADVLTRLAAVPSVSFILTMRGSQYPSSNTIDWSTPRLLSLAQLELDAAQEAFIRISPDSADDPELRTLLQELDCIPLAITLMAKLAEAGDTVPELLLQWRTERTRILDQPGGDRRNSIEVSIKLSLQSRSVRASPHAIQLLSILARLPAGTALARLPDICPSVPSWKAALRVLRGAALVYDSPNKSSIQILSPIRSYALLHHQPPTHALEDLRTYYYKLAVKGDSEPGELNFIDNKKELATEEANMEAILLDGLQDPTGERDDAIVASELYSTYLYWNQPRVNIIEAAVKMAREISSHRLAYCLRRYGLILKLMDQYGEAQSVLEEARSEYTSSEDLSGAARCIQLVGEILSIQGQYDKAQAAIEEAKSEYTKLGNRLGAANCLQSLGDMLWEERKLDAAQAAILEAKSEFTSLGHRLGATNCLLSLGDILRLQNKTEAATSAYTEARSDFLDLGEALGAASSLWSLGEIYRQQLKNDLARSVLEEARTEYSDQGISSGVANCLSSLGIVSQNEGKYSLARSQFQEAKAIYSHLQKDPLVLYCDRQLESLSEAEKSASLVSQ